MNKKRRGHVPVFIKIEMFVYLKYFPTTGSDDAGKSLLNNMIM